MYNVLDEMAVRANILLARFPHSQIFQEMETRSISIEAVIIDKLHVAECIRTFYFLCSHVTFIVVHCMWVRSNHVLFRVRGNEGNHRCLCASVALYMYIAQAPKYVAVVFIMSTLPS